MKKIISICCLIMVTASITAGPIAYAADSSSLNSTMVHAIENTMPSVVSIEGKETVPAQDIPLSKLIRTSARLSRFGIDTEDITIEIPSHERTTSGAGFIVNKNGYIVTNNHVIENQNEKYTVTFQNGSTLPAKIVFQDTKNDIALIKVDGTYDHVANLGDSSNISVGEKITSIGNAFGEIMNAVSLGQITAIDKDISALDGKTTEKLHNVTETDAYIVPGYSGGPVIDEDGNVIGMNVASGDDQSYLIPINLIKNIIDKEISS